MTERAADLTDYPGQLVFPGGGVEPGDDGPVSTALREAHEEVGLDVESAEVIGLLTTLALPDGGFLVTPVLAWSSHPVFSRSVNYAEVAAMHHVPLSELANRATDQGPQRHPHSAVGASRGPDLTNLGRMTETVVDQLLGIFLR